MHRRLDRFAVYKIQIWFHNNIHKEDKTIMVPVLSSVACALISTLGETLLVCFFFFFFDLNVLIQEVPRLAMLCRVSLTSLLKLEHG